MAGSSNYPGALDDFSAQSPTNLGDDDSTGRTHSERHDDLEAAMEAVQGELGVDPSGASASTVAVRFTSLDSSVAGKVSASIVTASAQVLVGAASSSVAALSSGSAGQVLTVSGSATYGLAWLDPAGGATVEMSPTEPVSPDNGTLWVDTDSDVPTFTASAYVINSGGSTITVASGSTVPLTIQNNGTGNSLVVNDVASDTTPFVIGADGRVSIGTTNTPSNKNTITPVAVVNGNGLDGSMQIVRNTTPGGGGGIIELTSTRGTDVNSYTILQDGDGVGSLIFAGADGNEFVPAAAIVCQVDGAPGNDDMPGRILFQTTADGGSSATERMRITSSGRIQIPAGGVLEAPISTNAQTDSYTLVLADAGKLVEMGKATAQTLTIPLNSSVPFPTGTKIDVIQTGAGETTIAGAGVTINSEGSKLKLNAQWAAATLIKRSTDTWVLIGSLKA